MELLGMGLLGWLPLFIVFYVFIAVVFASQLYTGDYTARGLVGMTWPIWITLTVVRAPFAAVGWLGERFRNLSWSDR